MLYLLTFLWCLPSPVLIFMNAEAWVVGHALLHDGVPLFVGLTAAAGQVAGYAVFFFASDRLCQAIPRLRARLAAFDVARYRQAAYFALATGAVFGVPPTVLLTAANRALGYRFLPFLLVVTLGRVLRFTALACLPDAFAAVFPPS